MFRYYGVWKKTDLSTGKTLDLDKTYKILLSQPLKTTIVSSRSITDVRWYTESIIFAIRAHSKNRN